MGMATDYPNSQAWLEDIRRRREAAPDDNEIQAALDQALADGFSITQVASMMGISRSWLYQGNFDLSAGQKRRKAQAEAD